MRRSKQELNKEDVVSILKRNTNMVLGLNEPYTVPLSYVYHNGYIYFHSALEGHKLDLIKNNNDVSFCIIDQDMIVGKEFTTYFRSVIGKGKAYIVEDAKEIYDSLYALGMKYSKAYENMLDTEISSSIKNVRIIKIEIDEVTGKEAIELVREKNNVK